MATDTLRAESASANPIEQIRELSRQVQTLARRIGSVAHALDDALDFSTHDAALRAQLGRMIDFVNIIQETAATAADKGEEIETLAYRSERGGK